MATVRVKANRLSGTSQYTTALHIFAIAPDCSVFFSFCIVEVCGMYQQENACTTKVRRLGPIGAASKVFSCKLCCAIIKQQVAILGVK